MANQKQVITEAARAHGIDPKILWGLYGTETAFGKNVNTSSAGAVGPFQFLPSTAKGMGVDPYNFKSAAFGAAKYLSQYKARGVGGMLSAYNAGPAGGYQASYVDTTLKNAKTYGGSVPSAVPGGPSSASRAPSMPTFDQAGFEKAQKGAILGKLIASEGGSKDNPLLATGLVSTKLPERSEYEGEGQTPEAHILKAEGHSKYVPAGSNVTKLSGTVDFGGKKVAAWIAPALKYAEAHGWKGSVESGYRSFAEQEHIYNSGVRPAAVPGTSNHEGDRFPRGAVDVTDAEQLSKILRGSPYANLLIWAGGKDPVHFSHPHNGSY